MVEYEAKEAIVAEQVFQIVIDYIALLGYTGIFIGMALESACIPVPSELIFGFAGYLVYLGKLDFTMSVFAGVSGGLLGSIVAYLIGFYGGQPFVTKYGKYMFLSKKHVDTAQRWFDRYGIKATFFSRLLPIVRTFISLPAGFAKVNLGKFMFYTVLGSLPWTVALIYAGQMLGENWRELNTMGHEASLIVAILLIAFAVYYFWKNRTQSDQN
ncbi:DedA family protein [Sporomusa sp. KB1]|jgi:membrane protein DedA with SNARE-associated domain|uniref:DedA family protein n=1 Tax=Sporomusa sp. KB1 TaxID=943346 RepID=UPI0011A787C2|nr:DedA family protein [Sporomusa sp. KB1]TWH49472.1 membrane protein DedA with SNARE-associated domain [Sporomusa sp. KB1]